MFSQAPKLSKDGTHWTFYPKDGTPFDVPAYHTLTIGDGTVTITLKGTTTVITLTYPTETTATNYTALVAQITPEGADGTYTDIDTRADNVSGWSVEGDLQGKKVTVTVEATPQVLNALLRVTLIRNDGSELTASRIVSWQGYTVDTETNTYTVYTTEGLLAWADDIVLYSCTLAADIDMSGQAWPEELDFHGTFDGAGHTISNLNVTGTSDVGFIAYLGGRGIVKNLLLVNATSNGSHRIGGITGSLYGGTVIACAVSGCKVSGENGTVGGIAGNVDDSGSVTACYAASCTVEGGYSSSIGHIAGDADGRITACYYAGEGNGVGKNGTGATRVEDNNWQAAAQAMNEQLADNNYIWAENTNEATKDDFPLVLVPNPDVQ